MQPHKLIGTARTGLRLMSVRSDKLQLDVTSDESDEPAFFDDWAADLDIGATLKEKAKRERKVHEDGGAIGRGKRKRAQAFVKIWEGNGEITINGKPMVEHFYDIAHRAEVLYPFEVTKTEGKFNVEGTVKGGGPTGQAGALQLAISKAIQNFEPDHRYALKRRKMLSTDIRRVQPKKWGKTKARRAWQWVKR
uniref:30S ribosomal protein S9 n=1 Tax=Lotharella oceanica TaxID=641309 RepID=A0A7S2XAV8_9EUKA